MTSQRTPAGDDVLVRSAPIPLYVQIRDHLVRQIDQGQLHPGDRLPSEPELVERYRVGRPTIRQAVALLRQEGRVVTQRGIGTFVASQTARISLLSFDGLTHVLRAQGLEVKDTILGAGTTPEPPLEVLTVEDDGEWWTIRRLRALARKGGCQPLCVEADSFPLSLYPDAEAVFAQTGSATSVLKAAYHEQIASSEVASRAIKVPDPLRGLLELRRGEAVLAMERVNRAFDGTVVHVGSFIIRTDLVPLVEKVPNLAADRLLEGLRGVEHSLNELAAVLPEDA